MSNAGCLYKHIIVGLDLTEESPQVMAKAVEIARACRAQLSAVHVLEPVAFAYGGDLPLDVAETQEIHVKKAAQQLQSLIQPLDFPIAQEHILVGQPAEELHFLAQQQSADLIIVGSHGRKGFALLLGSTPNSVLHGATCDVLAVYVKPS